MSLLNRRGFTLIELMVALVLLGIVSTAVYKVLVSNQRIYLAQTQQIDLQQNIRAAATILPAEFRELDAADGDIFAMSATSIQMRAMRQLAFVCVEPPLGGGIGQLNLTVRVTPIYGNRQVFQANDSLLIYWEGDPTTRTDDIWLPGKVKTAVLGPVCFDSSAAGPGTVANQGYTLNLQPQWINDPARNVTQSIPNGSPVRGFDNVTYSVYQAPAPDNSWYLGQQNNSAAGVMQPLVGPLIGANGVTFRYFDGNGAITADSSRVAQIEITLRARTASPIRDASGIQQYKVDSVTTRVTLRNNPRCGPGSFPVVAC